MVADNLGAVGLVDPSLTPACSDRQCIYSSIQKILSRLLGSPPSRSSSEWPICPCDCSLWVEGKKSFLNERVNVILSERDSLLEPGVRSLR
jgi:hypothetical protein